MTRLLIVNADDLGYDPAVTEGIVKCMREGVVSSATLMVNTPFSEEAGTVARGLSLGLHLNLARWAPVSSAIPPEFLRSGEWDESKAGQLPSEAVAHEIRAQLRRFESLTGTRATHLDVHKHLHRHPAILEAVTQVAADEQIPVRALDEAMRALLQDREVLVTDHFIGDAGIEPYWTLSRWQTALGALEEGITELMCHPGYTPRQVSSGYGAQREVELATFTSTEARDALATSGVTLVDFSAVD